MCYSIYLYIKYTIRLCRYRKVWPSSSALSRTNNLRRAYFKSGQHWCLLPRSKAYSQLKIVIWCIKNYTDSSSSHLMHSFSMSLSARSKTNLDKMIDCFENKIVYCVTKMPSSFFTKAVLCHMVLYKAFVYILIRKRKYVLLRIKLVYHFPTILATKIRAYNMLLGTNLVPPFISIEITASMYSITLYYVCYSQRHV